MAEAKVHENSLDSIDEHNALMTENKGENATRIITKMKTQLKKIVRDKENLIQT